MKLNFKDPEALRVLTKCCLHKDFNLDVELPANKLLPTIPLRLNYILWIEDLLQYAGITDNATGVDIGTGAAAIYCLLALKMHSDWKMYGLEADEINCKYASDNISNNLLQNRITVVQQNADSKIFNRLFEEIDATPKTFCCCNPPFFTSADDALGENRTGKRKAPKSANSGSNLELIYKDGGELEFVKRILEESIELQDKIQIYTTMMGCKKNFQKLIEAMSERNISNFTTTEFCQGKTTRWFIAWSFKHDLKSFRNLLLKKPSTIKNVLKYDIPMLDFDCVVARLKDIFMNLKIKIKILEENAGNFFRWELIAQKNTWSNQRRKRRAEIGINSTIAKQSSAMDPEILNIGFEVQKLNDRTRLRMFYISGTMDKDCVNQILQFIKNRFQK